MSPTTIAPPQLADRAPEPPAAAADAPSLRACFVAPRHKADPDWLWVTHVGPMVRAFRFERIHIDNTFAAVPKLTRLYQQWQYRRAIGRIAASELAFIFSTDVAAGVTGWMSRGRRMPPRIYVGFTQDGHWPARRIESSGRALRQCDLVTVFSEEERQVLIPRYGFEPERVRVVPIHTDETEGYGQYPDEPPRPEPYILSMGSPNRRFMPAARACRDLGVPLVIITRPWHGNDSLEELAGLGAEIITDAGKMKALTYLKHARAAVMTFDDASVPGGFTTLVHAMFMRTPFIAERCLGMDEHVIDGQTGYVTPHGDEDALREAIDCLWTEPERARVFGESAYQRAVQRHSLEAAAESFHALALEALSLR